MLLEFRTLAVRSLASCLDFCVLRSLRGRSSTVSTVSWRMENRHKQKDMLDPVSETQKTYLSRAPCYDFLLSSFLLGCRQGFA